MNGRTNSRLVLPLAVAAVIVVARPTPASATPVTVVIGTFSFDQLIPSDDTAPGTNAFTIWNLTGMDVGVSGEIFAPALSLLDLVATLVPGSGAPDVTVSVGDVAPGPFVDASGFPPTILQFSANGSFAAATLTGRIAALSTTLADGSVLSVPELLFTASLAPADGFLAAGRDLVDISITADVSAPSTVPEPGTLALLASGLSVVARRRITSHRG